MKEENLAIGEAALLLGLSHDTLRYYERIGLLPPIARTPAGVRRYQSDDLSRLRFIQRTKSMGFTLDEIAALLKMRAAPREARQKVRRLALVRPTGLAGAVTAGFYEVLDAPYPVERHIVRDLALGAGTGEGA